MSEPSELKIWKFVITPNEWKVDPANPGVCYQGCVTAIVAESAEQARLKLIDFAAANGFDVGWLRAARVIELPIRDGTMIAWAQL